MSRCTMPCLLAVALAACGGDTGAPAPVDSTVAAATGPIAPPTLGADTMVSAQAYRCGDGSEWSVTVWRGPGSRVTVSSTDTSYLLPQRVAASGVRYADSTERVVWWNKGDSATMERGGRSTPCGPATDIVF